MFGSLQSAGTVVEFDGNPGVDMEPLDDEGWKRFHEYREWRKQKGWPPLTRHPFAVIEAKVTGAPQRPANILVPIPEDWRELKGLALTNLALRLGAARGIKAEQAANYIENEEARRAIAQFSGDGSETTEVTHDHEQDVST